MQEGAWTTDISIKGWPNIFFCANMEIFQSMQVIQSARFLSDGIYKNFSGPDLCYMIINRTRHKELVWPG